MSKLSWQGNGDNLEQELRSLLMDSTAFAVEFKPGSTPKHRHSWFATVERIYREMGGGGIDATPSPSNPNEYLIRPKDDPAQNPV